MDVSTTVTTLDAIVSENLLWEELSLNVSVDTITDGKGVSDESTFSVKNDDVAKLDIASSGVVVKVTVSVDTCSGVDWVKKDDNTSPVEAKASVLVKPTASWEENESIGETNCEVVSTGDGVGSMKVVWVAATTVSDPVVVLALEELVLI